VFEPDLGFRFVGTLMRVGNFVFGISGPTISNIVLQESSYLFRDTNAVGQPQRFYRVAAQ
jgi:hypothetical protein